VKGVSLGHVGENQNLKDLKVSLNSRLRGLTGPVPRVIKTKEEERRGQLLITLSELVL